MVSLQGKLYFFYTADRKMEMLFLLQGHTPRHVQHWNAYFLVCDHFLYPTVAFSPLQVRIKNAFNCQEITGSKNKGWFSLKVLHKV